MTVDFEVLNSMSRMQALLECPEKFRLGYVERLTPKSKGASLWIGSLMHGWLERYYKGEDAAAFLAAETERALAGVDTQRDADMLAQNLGMVQGMVAAYPRWAAPKDAGFETLAVEQEAEYLGVRFRVDLVVRLKRDGKVYVVEHKTVSHGYESRYGDKVKFDLQPSLYVAGLRADGVGYNLLAKPAIRLRKGENRLEFARRLEAEYTVDPEKYFQRLWYPLGSAVNDRVVREVNSVRRMFEALTQLPEGAWPHNTSACHNYGMQCQFLNLCAGVENAEDLYDRRPERPKEKANDQAQSGK